MAICFRVEGDLRFISHHDTMRMFERAFSRARLPVSFSEGFNPRPRMSLPLPRPVGVATLCDVLVIELSEFVDASQVLDRLSRQMPADLALLETFEPPAGGKLHPEQVVYEMTLPEEQMPVVQQAVERLTSAESWPIQRTDERGRPGRTIDLRPLLVEASVQPGVLRWIHRVNDTGSARLREWLQAFGLDASETLHRVTRTEIHWRAEARAGHSSEPAPAANA